MRVFLFWGVRCNRVATVGYPQVVLAPSLHVGSGRIRGMGAFMTLDIEQADALLALLILLLLQEKQEKREPPPGRG